MTLRTLPTLLALVTLPLTAPAADAATAHAVAFTGTFHTSCGELPSDAEGPKDGYYDCSHTATSVTCAAVADSGAVTAYVKTCRADLVSGYTVGAARAVDKSRYLWVCDGGNGNGMFRYQPSPLDPAINIPVGLVVTGTEVIVTGSFFQAGSARAIVVRARFPAVCAYETHAPGYSGTITPV